MIMKRGLTLLSLLLLGAVVAAAQKLEKNNPPALSKPAPGTYTHVVKAGKLLFIAGQTGVDAAGKVAGPGMKEQLEQVMINLLAALKSEGADFSHVAKTTTFVTSISEFRSPGGGCRESQVSGRESSGQHAGADSAAGRSCLQGRDRGDRRSAVTAYLTLMARGSNEN